MVPLVRMLLERAVAAGLTPGAVATWKLDGEPWVEVVAGRGGFSPRSCEASSSLRYDLASLTKPLATTVLTLLAARDGRLELDAPIGELVPSCGQAGRATVRQILAHTGGFPEWVPLATLADGAPELALRALRSLDLVDEPGRSTRYSCAGFLLLGAALERCLGSDLATAFRNRVAGPLGIEEEVGYLPDPAQVPLASGALSVAWEQRMARESGAVSYPVPPQRPGLPDDGNARFLGGVAANAGLFGTARAVGRLASVWLPGGEVLHDAERAEALCRQTPADQPPRAMGWQLAGSPGSSAGPSLSARAIGHTGFTGCSVWIEPDRGTILVLLSNRHHPDHRAADLHPLRRRFHSLVLGAHR